MNSIIAYIFLFKLTILIHKKIHNIDDFTLKNLKVSTSAGVLFNANAKGEIY